MDQPIGFSLSSIATEQFAIIEQNFSENNEVFISTTLRFGKHDEDKEIAVSALFKFEIESQPFILIEGACRFKIEPASWGTFVKDDKMIIPKGFLTHLAILTIGTVRGILHAKTENTSFNHFVIPTIDVTEIITEDYTFG